MKRIILLITALVVLTVGGLLAASQAGGASGTTTTTETSTTAGTWADPAYQAQVKKTYHASVRYQHATLHLLRLRGAKIPPGWGHKLTMTHSLPYEQWREGLWRTRYLHAKARLGAWNRMWNTRNRDIEHAMHAAAKRYGVSYSHLYSCSGSEGGHGTWVWNSSDGHRRTIRAYPLSRYPNSAHHPAGSSGAGGWLQFMSGTFNGAVRKTDVPRRFWRWDSPVGQAYAAAYMFKSGGISAWAGGGC